MKMTLFYTLFVQFRLINTPFYALFSEKNRKRFFFVYLIYGCSLTGCLIFPFVQFLLRKFCIAVDFSFIPLVPLIKVCGNNRVAEMKATAMYLMRRSSTSIKILANIISSSQKQLSSQCLQILRRRSQILEIKFTVQNL